MHAPASGECVFITATDIRFQCGKHQWLLKEFPAFQCWIGIAEVSGLLD